MKLKIEIQSHNFACSFIQMENLISHCEARTVTGCIEQSATEYVWTQERLNNRRKEWLHQDVEMRNKNKLYRNFYW